MILVLMLSVPAILCFIGVGYVITKDVWEGGLSWDEEP